MWSSDIRGHDISLRRANGQTVDMETEIFIQRHKNSEMLHVLKESEEIKGRGGKWQEEFASFMPHFR